MHNFKKVSSTLAEKHQLMHAYRCSGSYFPVSTEAKQAVPLDLDTYTDAIQRALIRVGASAEDQVTFELNFRGTTYKKGFYVPVGYDDSVLLFGEILFMLMRNLEVYFVTRIHQSEFRSDMHDYLIHSSKEISRFVCLKSEDLLDFYPLPAYGRGNALLIPLKHAFSDF